MKWTKEKPDEAGYYWQRNSCRDPKPIVVNVSFIGNGCPYIYVTGSEEQLTMSDFPRTAQWCKIPEPEK